MKKYNFWLLAISALLISTLTACDSQLTSKVLSSSSTSRTINVTGNGSVIGEPDIATLNLGVSVQKKTVAEAREVAATAMTAVIDSLKTNKIDEKDISTENFSIYPEYDWTEEGRVLRGYRVSNTVRAKVRELDTLSDVIDDAAKAGRDNIVINSIQFMIDDNTAYQEQARSLAVKNAAAKAQTLADASGVTLGKPITITENTYIQSPPVQFDMAEAALDDGGRASTPIIPGELTITVNVSVVYEIE